MATFTTDLWNHRYRGITGIARTIAVLLASEGATEKSRAINICRGQDRHYAFLMARSGVRSCGIIDGASFTAPQAFYYGSAGGVRIFVDLVDPPGGRFIDLADDLDVSALNKRGESWDAHNRRLSACADAEDKEDIGILDSIPNVEDIRAELLSIPANRWDDDYTEWLSVGQGLHHAFDGSDEGLALWDEASQRCATYDPDELESTWSTFGNYSGKPITLRTIHRLARIAGEAEEVLKYLVTSPHVEIERKGVDSINLPSVLRMFISANAEWVVPASRDERRWTVLDVSDARKGDSAHFAALRAEMDGDGPAALLHFLQTYDLTAFNVRQAPETEGLLNQKLASLRGIHKWWFESLVSGEVGSNFLPEPWEDGWQIVDCDELRGGYISFMRNRRFDGEPLDAATFGKQLREMLPSIDHLRRGGRKRRAYAYKLPPLSLARRAFDKWIGSPIDWDSLH